MKKKITKSEAKQLLSMLVHLVLSNWEEMELWTINTSSPGSGVCSVLFLAKCLLLALIVIVRGDMGNNSAEQTGEFSEHSKCSGVLWRVA